MHGGNAQEGEGGVMRGKEYGECVLRGMLIEKIRIE